MLYQKINGMCFNARYGIAAALKRADHDGRKDDIEFWQEILKKYDATFPMVDNYQVSAFTHPKLIIYDNYHPKEPVIATWGLIPHWAKACEEIWNTTLNARGETIFEKASFKKSALEKRCLIPAEGFYEHHEFKGKKYPFYITRKDGEPLYFAGLWNDWVNPSTGEIINTCSVVTTHANPLMTRIHNKPKLSGDHRMPVILGNNLADEWLKNLSEEEIRELATYQFPDSMLDSWTVRKLSGKDSPGNVPEANEKYDYQELVLEDDNQLKLF